MVMDTRYLFTLCSLLITIHSMGQTTNTDTTFLTLAKKNQEEIYNRFIHGQSRLYNGSEYRDYLSRNDEHPYYGIDDWSYGDIVYDDELYKNVPIFYDLSRDKVISEHLLNGAKLELVSEKIASFSMAGHTFVRLQKDKNNIITTGFYDQLYDGQTKVYARREKMLQQRVESNDIIALFEERNRLLILKDGKYFPVKKKGTVLDVFEDHKQEVKSFINKNKIRFKSSREADIVRVAAYYDTLNK
jgi:hypothetical protein